MLSSSGGRQQQGIAIPGEWALRTSAEPPAASGQRAVWLASSVLHLSAYKSQATRQKTLHMSSFSQEQFKF